MTREVAAACQGALSAGAAEVLVKDAHDSARNIDPAGLPRGIRMNRSWSGDPLSMMSGLNQEKFDAGILHRLPRLGRLPRQSPEPHHERPEQPRFPQRHAVQ